MKKSKRFVSLVCYIASPHINSPKQLKKCFIFGKNRQKANQKYNKHWGQLERTSLYQTGVTTEHPEMTLHWNYCSHVYSPYSEKQQESESQIRSWNPKTVLSQTVPSGFRKCLLFVSFFKIAANRRRAWGVCQKPLLEANRVILIRPDGPETAEKALQISTGIKIIKRFCKVWAIEHFFPTKKKPYRIFISDFCCSETKGIAIVLWQHVQVTGSCWFVLKRMGWSWSFVLSTLFF